MQPARRRWHWPQATPGWVGLALLTLFYGIAFTVMFVLLPRLGVAANSPILNTEPVAALVMAWALLGQTIAPLQLLGCTVRRARRLTSPQAAPALA